MIVWMIIAIYSSSNGGVSTMLIDNIASEKDCVAVLHAMPRWGSYTDAKCIGYRKVKP